MLRMLDITKKPVRPLVAVSILSADFGKMAEDCETVLGMGADLLHLDVMDGHFAPNLTMGVDMIKGVRRHLPEVCLDVHMMVEKPGDYVEAYAKAGANNYSFHWEVTTNAQGSGAPGGDANEMISRIHDLGMTAGMVVNPGTEARVLEPFLDRINVALVMSVWPGFSGQKFMPEVLEKVKWLHEVSGDHVRIEMDGGIGPVTSVDAAAAGCDMMVSASAIFGSDDWAGVIKALHDSPLPR
ncbi:ribulose-phosphate 3-epimerase [Poriferisphaera sp. WC338]|uniref:ribulose-phosphate 3-epimerase n=1 Tax=Poriferisphaera sp. WC338 TaxID=3425129 RepID=UPI003D818ACF